MIPFIKLDKVFNLHQRFKKKIASLPNNLLLIGEKINFLTTRVISNRTHNPLSYYIYRQKFDRTL